MRLPVFSAITLLRPLCAAFVIPVCVGAVLPHTNARAQAIDLSHGGQITVTAVGGFDWDQNQKKITAYKDARAVRGDATVTADKLIAYYRKKSGTDDAKTGAAPLQTAPQKTAAPPADASAGPMDSSGSNEIYRLEAIGHVHIFTQTDQAWGDKAVYDMDKAVLVMTGKNMKMVTPQDLLTARDSMEYYSQDHISIGRGNATVTTNDHRQIKADVLVGYSAPADEQTKDQDKATKAQKSQGGLADGSGKLKKVDAFGHVWVRTPTEVVTGERGVYVPDTGIARIVGNVHITRGANQIQGAAAIINLHTGIATMTEQPGNRVNGVVVPNSKDSTDRK
ncbi:MULTISPECIES: LptA/OstA family protein [Acetobacter]|uniref:Organic solvent tolerance-like N-terminal domain-containing protein n=1 Tax=Acetobacter thailandicus TaxID=1502842 RepID=A0ABT3QBN5_9PROT|nr:MULTISPECIES: LptA/OstA family protein [Acetobacter]MBS0959120.1 hypothetical protein [Acetobacter thailandicus]MBS0984993.1 hypothetical protein [Acetobacter thailandicus]MCX2562698.1 hypothetical protein [Acetobacter thailandicus]NHN94763.1 hypothetical protein [Acetobacter thailandicus]OUJ10099.1 hypothetical protein HK25_08210 [Acetobacter sp. DsW_059]